MSDRDTISHDSRNPQIDRPGMDAWLVGLLTLTTAVRLLAIGKPLLGNFATKSVIYAMIARNWVRGKTDICYPLLDCLRGSHRSLYMLEFPFSAYLTGYLWKTFGGSLEVWGRLVSLGFSLASVWLLFLLVRRRHGRTAAFGAGMILALSPYAIVYGQDFTIEASLLFFCVATIYCLQRWLTCGRGIIASAFWLVAFAISFALLLLTKIVMLVLLLPIVFMIFWEYRTQDKDLGTSDRQSPQTHSLRPRTKAARVVCLLIAGLALLPAVAWYAHAMQTAAPDSELSDRVFYSVRHSAADHHPPHPLLGQPAFYRQLLDDLMGPVLTPLGFVLLGLGFLDRRWRSYAAWLAASAFLIVALPRKFNELNYYCMTVLPPLCIVAGLGWALLVKGLRPGRVTLTIWLLVALVVSLRYAGGPLLVIPDEDIAVLAAASEVKLLSEPDEPIVVMHGTSIVMAYYCDRPTWTVTADQMDIKARLEECRCLGAKFLVVLEPDEVGVDLPEIVRGDGYWIYKL